MYHIILEINWTKLMRLVIAISKGSLEGVEIYELICPVHVENACNLHWRRLNPKQQA